MQVKLQEKESNYILIFPFSKVLGKKGLLKEYLLNSVLNVMMMMMMIIIIIITIIIIIIIIILVLLLDVVVSGSITILIHSPDSSWSGRKFLQSVEHEKWLFIRVGLKELLTVVEFFFPHFSCDNTLNSKDLFLAPKLGPTLAVKY